MMSRMTPFCLILLLSVSWFAPEAYAQVGQIQGTVTDAQGNPLEGVEITIQGMEVRRNYKVETNDEGKFFHGGVSLQGTYRVIAKKEGYQSTYAEGVRAAFRGSSETEEGRGVINFTMNQGEAGKLAFEMTDEEREELKRQAEEARKAQEKLSRVREQLNTGIQLYNQGEYEQAIESFQAGIERDPEQPALWANMGNAHLRLRQFDQAVTAYEKAIALSPEDPVLYQNLGGVYSAMGDSDKAKEAYEKAATIGAGSDPKAAATNYYNMGVTFINSGRTKEASEALQKAVQADPSHAEAHYQLGLTLLGLNQVDQSVVHLKKYVELKPTGSDAEVAKQLIEQLQQQ